MRCGRGLEGALGTTGWRWMKEVSSPGVGEAEPRTLAMIDQGPFPESLSPEHPKKRSPDHWCYKVHGVGRPGRVEI